MINFMWDTRKEEELVTAKVKVGRLGFSLTVLKKTVERSGFGEKKSHIWMIKSKMLVDIQVDSTIVCYLYKSGVHLEAKS